MLCFTSSMFSAETRTTEPFFVLTIGDSIVSTGTAIPPFPGNCNRSWVPAAIKPWSTCIVAGWMPTAAKPVFRDLPYLRRNPPCLEGKEKIGRPAMTSFMKPADFFLEVLGSSFSQSHPWIPSFSMIAQTLAARPTIPSFTTRRAPPLTWLVSMRGRFRKVDTSTGSDSVPVTSTGSH